ncbi:hypothetical protein FB563_1499 [Streptomyces puniciscabiei]|uniref:Uncharacterized protein n=1 Tax=Streptomyces puniciscabiei TaxID=164348 RepID=A0A542UBU2_9ACTN|nr:hypothetical protein [Streptomyces puniciscabiei]TQK96553.1 hypothetical protein FB563_1499 [Streptomyces puniciscabiei]
MAYYEPFLAAIDMGDSNSSSDHFVAARFEPFRVRVGLLRPIADRVRQARAGQVSGLYGSVKEILLNTQERNLGRLEGHTATDGTLVETDWGAQLALNDR